MINVWHLAAGVVLVLVVVLPTSPRRLKLREAMSGRLSSILVARDVEPILWTGLRKGFCPVGTIFGRDELLLVRFCTLGGTFLFQMARQSCGTVIG
jgi:hypothetical protein